MDDYADSYEPLIARITAPSVIEVIDDFNYNLLKLGNFATSYSQFQQKNCVQLPGDLVKPKKLSKFKFTFTPAKPVEEDESQPLPKPPSLSEPPSLPDQPSPESQHEMKSSSDSSLSSSSSSQSSSSQSPSSEDEAINVNAI